MKQLTVNEIDELRAKAIQQIDEFSEGKPVPWKKCKIKNVYKEFAKAIREADEKAGVLILVKGEAKVGDIMVNPDNMPAVVLSNAKFKRGIHDITDNAISLKSALEHQDVAVIIQRDNIPAYHCKAVS